MLSRRAHRPIKKIQFITDIEGDLSYFTQVIQESEIVEFDKNSNFPYRLRFKTPDSYFVCGGDVCDRGDPTHGGGDLRILKSLVDFKKDQPDRVILLIGNRDANKVRLRDELPIRADHILPNTVDIIKPSFARESYRDFLIKKYDVHNTDDLLAHNTPVNRLKWILTCTMSSEVAFDYRKKELAVLHYDGEINRVCEADVYRSFRESLEPNGLLYDYLAHAQFSWKKGNTLFIHGGIVPSNMGLLPKDFMGEVVQEATGNIRQWIKDVNAWGVQAFHLWNTYHSDQSQVRDYQFQHVGPHVAFRDYGSGNGIYEKITAVTAKLMHAQTGVMNAIEPTVARYLLSSCINLVVSGHQPHGDTPCVLVGNAAENDVVMVDADTLYSHRDAYDIQIGSGIRATDPRGCAYSVLTLVQDAGTTRVCVKGRDGYGEDYTFEPLLEIQNNRVTTDDPFIGRVVVVNGQQYLVRMNNSKRAKILPNIPYDWTDNNPDEHVINNNRNYVLTTIEKPFSIRYFSATTAMLDFLAKAGYFINGVTCQIEKHESVSVNESKQ